MEKSVKLALVGANEQQDPLIRKARSMGYETHVFAWQTGHEVGAQTADHFYPISAANKEAILEKCQALGVQAIVSIGSDAAARTCAYVAQQMGFPTTAYADVCNASNKLRSREILAKHGFAQPEYLEITDAFDAEKLRMLSFPVVVKPADRSGGRGLQVVQTDKRLFQAINKAREISAEGKAIAEKYMDGQCYSCECISFGGEHKILGFTKRETRQWNGAVVETAHMQPGRLPRSVRQRIESEIPCILDAFAIRYGATSVEFIVDAEKNHAYIEITPTMYGDFIGSHLVEAATGFDYLRAVIDVAFGRPIVAEKQHVLASAEVRFVCQRKDMPDAENACMLSALDAAELPENFDGSRHGSYLLRYPTKSFGGSNPLELPVTVQGDARFQASNSVALNSEYTALWYALKSRNIRRLHMPHYMASAWQRAIAELNVEICSYPIHEDLSPDIFEEYKVEADDAILLVDYFGLCSNEIPLWIQQLQSIAGQDLCVIVDASMAYFSDPSTDPNVFTIFSCRKFFGVPDGAYLYNSRMCSYPKLPLETNVVCRSAIAQLIALELGESAAYKAMQTQEQEMIKHKRYMSNVTAQLLQTINMEQVKAKRHDNYLTLDRVLGQYQQLPRTKGVDPVSAQCYPLLVSAEIREELVEEKIFVPQLWRKHLEEEFNGTVEQRLAKNLLCLPIEQRYSAEDMKNIADIITALLN